MTLRQLERLAQEGEHQHLEFKRKAAHPRKIVRELVAFANRDGGQLLIGVDDDGKIYGTKTPEEDLYAMENALEKYVFPKLEIGVEHVRVNVRREVLVYDVSPSETAPHFVREEGKNRAYVRIRDRSAQASREYTRVLRGRRATARGVRFEYDDEARLVLDLLAKGSPRTFEDVRAGLGRGRRRTSDLLVTLVRAGLLHLRPGEGSDTYTLAEEAFG